MTIMPYRILFFVTAVCAATAASPSPTTLEQGYAQMYNLQFNEAHQTFQEWQHLHPEDALGPASDAAAYLFGEFDRLHILQSEFFTQEDHFYTDHKLVPDPEVKKKFEADLNRARTLASRQPNDPNAMFAALLAVGLRSDYNALIEKSYHAAFVDMKGARAQADKLLARDPTYYDAWIAIGVENYMLSTKAAPLRWLLRLAGGETDRATGIARLRLTAEKGHYLAPFARLLLAVAALRDKDFTQARTILDALAKEYPRNPLYGQELARLQAPQKGIAR
jgi:hypothetical protein